MTNGDDSSGLSMATAFELLSNPRRRFTIYYLSQHEGEVPLNEFVVEVAARENDVDVEEVSDTQRKRTYVSLYQTHLPKLKAIGIIRFDRDRSVVELTDRAEELVQYLPGDDRRVPWPLYYLALVVGSGVLNLFVLSDISVFGLVPDVTAGAVIIVTVGVLSVVHLFVERRSGTTDFSSLIEE